MGPTFEKQKCGRKLEKKRAAPGFTAVHFGPCCAKLLLSKGLQVFILFPSSQAIPTPSMYGIFTYIWLIFMVNVGEYTIHGWYGICLIAASIDWSQDCFLKGTSWHKKATAMTYTRFLFFSHIVPSKSSISFRAHDKFRLCDVKSLTSSTRGKLCFGARLFGIRIGVPLNNKPFH